MSQSRGRSPGRSPGRRSQAERRAASESRLLRAAAELIVERGIERTSLTAIGERAGLSHTLVNHLFGSKGALVERLNDLAVEYYMDRAVGLRENRTGLEALTASARLYLELATAADPIGRVHVVMWAEAVDWIACAGHRPCRYFPTVQQLFGTPGSRSVDARSAPDVRPARVQPLARLRHRRPGRAGPGGAGLA